MNGSMARYLLRFGMAACVFVLTAAAGVGLSAQTAQGAPGRFDGRWIVPSDPWFDQLATAPGQGRGGAGRGGQAPAHDVVLELRVTSAGGVTGRATGVSGRRGAPGSHPAHDVEISRGTLKGDRLSFQIWRFDGFHNRLHVSARVAGGDLELEFRRDSPAGPQVFTTRARRAKY